MILYFPYLFIYTFQLLAQMYYPVTLPNTCDFIIRFLLEKKAVRLQQSMTFLPNVTEPSSRCLNWGHNSGAPPERKR